MKPKKKPYKSVLLRRREKRYLNRPTKLRIRNELRKLLKLWREQ